MGADARGRTGPARVVAPPPPGGLATGRAREVAVVVRAQALATSPGVRRGAVLLSRAGEHALGPIALGLAGAALHPPQRRRWLRATAAVLGAHALSVLLKRLVRRPRPTDPRILVLVRTPGRFGFPSSHAASTTAAAVAYSRLLGRRSTLAAIPVMMASRLVVGVHYPSDVVGGAIIGVAAGWWAGGGNPAWRAARRGRSAVRQPAPRPGG